MTLPGGKLYQKREFSEPTGVAVSISFWLWQVGSCCSLAGRGSCYCSKVSPDGSRVAVCDFGNCRIKVFDPNGELIVVFGFRGTQRGQFQQPECLAVDDKGQLTIQRSQKLRRVTNFPFQFQGLFWWATTGTEGSRFFDRTATLYVRWGQKEEAQANLTGFPDWPYRKKWISSPPISRITASRSSNWLPSDHYRPTAGDRRFRYHQKRKGGTRRRTNIVCGDDGSKGSRRSRRSMLTTVFSKETTRYS